MSPRTPRKIKPEIGATGLVQYGGIVYDELLLKLQGERGRRVYREMADNDPVIGAILFAIDMLMRQVSWKVEVDEERLERTKVRFLNLKGNGNGAGTEIGSSGLETSGRLLKAAGVMPGRTTSRTAAGTSPAYGGTQSAMTGGSKLVAVPFPRGKAGGNGTGNGAGNTAGGDTAASPRLQIDQALRDEADRYAEFIASCKDDMSESWGAHLSSVLSMLPYGWSYFESVYKLRGGPDDDAPERNSAYDDGLIGWRKMAIRAQETLVKWEFDENGGIQGMWQRAAPNYQLVFIPIGRSLLFRTQSHKNNPEGRSCLRNAYRPWWFKKQIEEIEAIGIERDLAGLPVAWVPSQMLSNQATDDEKRVLTEIKTIVRNIRRDEQEGLVMPLDYDDSGNKRFDLQLLSAGGERQFETDKIVARYDQRIAMTVLADFILLGHETVGSFALGASKVDLFVAALESWLNAVSQVYNTFAIPRLMRINGFPVELSPTLTHSEIKQVDLQQLAQYVQALSGAGMPLFPDEDLEVHLRQQAGLPNPSPELKEAIAAKEEQQAEIMSAQLESMHANADVVGEQAKQPASASATRLTPSSAKPVAKHLGGQHDQSTHGDWADGGKDGHGTHEKIDHPRKLAEYEPMLGGRVTIRATDGRKIEGRLVGAIGGRKWGEVRTKLSSGHVVMVDFDDVALIEKRPRGLIPLGDWLDRAMEREREPVAASANGRGDGEADGQLDSEADEPDIVIIGPDAPPEDEILQWLQGEDEEVTKHLPGGHDQSSHGDWADGEGSAGNPNPGAVAARMIADARSRHSSISSRIQAALAPGARVADGGPKDHAYLESKLSNMSRLSHRPPDDVARGESGLQYNITTGAGRYTETANRILDQITGAGFKLAGARNYWEPAKGYRGFNTRWSDADGFEFEVQIHTHESYQAMKRNRAIYQETLARQARGRYWDRIAVRHLEEDMERNLAGVRIPHAAYTLAGRVDKPDADTGWARASQE